MSACRGSCVVPVGTRIHANTLLSKVHVDSQFNRPIGLIGFAGVVEDNVFARDEPPRVNIGSLGNLAKSGRRADCDFHPIRSTILSDEPATDHHLDLFAGIGSGVMMLTETDLRRTTEFESAVGSFDKSFAWLNRERPRTG